MTTFRSNRLARETSPYLLQHAHNPVDWYPWGDEALEAARSLDKPILLSVGYSACHWCHVMERESFENEETAALMNRLFINIKVDREERPDLDSIYMNYVQLTTGHGGWPLTVFLTPDLVPYFGGTYFPPVSTHGRPSFSSVLKQVYDFFLNQRDRIEQSKEKITQALADANRNLSGSGELSEQPLNDAFYGIIQQLDTQNGGFGSAPKFPASMVLRFLLRWHQRTGQPSALKAAELSLAKMSQGGIYDHLGGGFHRYSVDDRWLVPHFEKMLYDNALLARTYLEAFQSTGNSHYRTVVEETLEYVQREMTDSSGGFYSAEDADSEGVEGKFYIWQLAEIEEVLGRERARVFADLYEVSELGNWDETNILTLSGSVESKAVELGVSLPDLVADMNRARQELREVRSRRTRPGLDDKVLSSWNGMMLAAFAEAGFVLKRDDLLETARRNAAFIQDEMTRDGRLFRSWKKGSARLNGYLDDYAHVIDGMTALFQVAGDRRWLDFALTLTETVLDQFHDPATGEFFYTAKDHEELLVRPKELFDNATPSGNSSMAVNLILLSHLTGTQAYREQAERLVSRLANAIGRYPTGLGNWLQALDLLTRPMVEVVIVGDEEHRDRLLDPLRHSYVPNKVIVQAGAEASEGEAPLPLLEGRVPAVAGRAAAYVCRDHVCQEPTSDPERLATLLTGE